MLRPPGPGIGEEGPRPEPSSGKADCSRPGRPRTRNAATLRTPSRMKVGMVRMAELVGRLKLNGRLFERSPLSSVVELETLVVGVRGKEALWTALQTSGREARGRRPRCTCRIRKSARSRAGGATPECCSKRRSPRGAAGDLGRSGSRVNHRSSSPRRPPGRPSSAGWVRRLRTKRSPRAIPARSPSNWTK